MPQTYQHGTRQLAPSRRGAMTFEVVVAGVLLLVLISITAQVSVTCGRLWQETRRYQLASSELASEMERLTLLDEQQIVAALDQWSPAPDLVEVLPGVQLRGEVVKDQAGQRLKLFLNWQRQTEAPPLVLVGWLLKPPVTTDEG